MPHYRKDPMKPAARLGLVLATIAAAFTLATPAWAGSAHFVTSATAISRTDNTLTVSGKSAGLGDESQIHLVLTTTAACINPGNQDPAAANKQSLSVAADFPVQNGHSDWSLSVTATLQPSCSPPMTIVFSDVMVTDTTNGLVLNVPGTF
jgi:hypothetical protein